MPEGSEFFFIAIALHIDYELISCTPMTNLEHSRIRNQKFGTCCYVEIATSLVQPPTSRRFPKYMAYLRTRLEFARSFAESSLFVSDSSGARVVIHVDVPLAFGSSEAVQQFFNHWVNVSK